MPETRPCPDCGQPTSPISGLCENCAQPQGAASQQGRPQPQPTSQGQPSSAGILWAEVAGFLEIFALFAPIAIALVLVAMGVGSLLILLPAFLISVGIGAYNWRE